MLRITNLLVQASLQTGQTFRRIHVTAGSIQLVTGCLPDFVYQLLSVSVKPLVCASDKTSTFL